ncbi:GntR family transcriptional regulator [Proteiniclasticum sp.]|uniref:GntR family transcriptional regulator n=1 Tax=Proteiniclasticum sp. TaxID=2053595 RepID=UPI00289994FA|nr:GntR family transcriptional regulator [Proteiniclasticum sp.]
MKDKNSMFKLNTMGDDVYEEMKKDILNLHMKPGTPVTEQGICEKHGISRTPSRHVLQRLRDDGLIHSIPYKASFVSLLDFKKIEQIIFMRCAIEEKVIKEAMNKKNERFLKELKRSLRDQEDLLSEEFTPEEFYAMDAEFHAIWFRFTGKEFVWEEIERMLVHYKRFRMLDIVVVKDFQTIYEEHVELVQIIEEGKEELVEKKIAKHLYGGINRLGDKIHGEYKEYFIEDNA